MISKENQIMISNLRKKIQESKKEISKLELTIEIAEETITELSEDIVLNKDSNTEVVFMRDELEGFTDSQKFLSVLSVEKRFMKVKEIAEYLVLQLGEDVEHWKTKLSRNTRKLKEDNKIVSFQVGNSKSNFFWGSPKWVNSDGSIKEEYMYRTDAISSSRGKSATIEFDF